jgi:MFS family permease
MRSARLRALLYRERILWVMAAIPLGLVEGGATAVALKSRFAHVSPAALAFAVAFASGVSACANVFSLAWASLAHGRSRRSLLAPMLLGFAVSIASLPWLPIGHVGLFAFLLAVFVARILWAGIDTLRVSSWSHNYPRELRGTIAAKILMWSVPTVGASGLMLGLALDESELAVRALFGAAGLAGVVAAMRMRVSKSRQEWRLLAAEREALGPKLGLRNMRELFKSDPLFRGYMACMTLYGSGNLMLISLLVLVTSDIWGFARTQQVLITTVVPMIAYPLGLKFWARRFDTLHVLRYRVALGQVLCVAVAVLIAGAWFGIWPLMIVGAIILGLANAGSNLAWSLGHNDFAPPGEAGLYMGVHVTFTGIRGLLAPPIGVAAYLLLQYLSPGAGRWALLLPLGLTIAGAYGFVRLNQIRASAAGDAPVRAR